MNYYNEWDKQTAAWLRELIKDGVIPPGDVDERSITEVQPADLVGYTQCHFFAGIGGWSEALRLASWPTDRPVWTGSCPCQPFSSAGQQKGFNDERHLWPSFYRLISECRPAVTFGEQVSSALGREWLAGVRADLEGVGICRRGCRFVRCEPPIAPPETKTVLGGPRLWPAAQRQRNTTRRGTPATVARPSCWLRDGDEHLIAKSTMSSREHDFKRIKAAIEPELVLSSPNALVAKADSLPLLKRLPDHCVSLILTDPPYHATKKGNIYGDTAFEKDHHYLDWMTEFAAEWRRVLRTNGSLFCFCDSSMSGRLEGVLAKNFNVLSHIVWTKPNEPGFDGWKGKMKKTALRQWYPHSERIIFAEPAVEGNLFRSPFALFLRDARKKAGLSMHQLTAKIGAHGKVNHGGAVSNWEDGRNTPSRDQYEKMRKALMATGKVDPMPPYEDVIRPFFMDKTKEFTDVWTFPSVRPYKGKHPAEKPLALLEHAIAASSFPEDIVLDCFAGGGNTALAALKLGRKTVSIEIEERWTSLIASRIEDAMANETYFIACASSQLRENGGNGLGLPAPVLNVKPRTRQLPLFSVER